MEVVTLFGLAIVLSSDLIVTGRAVVNTVAVANAAVPALLKVLLKLAILLNYSAVVHIYKDKYNQRQKSIAGMPSFDFLVKSR